MRFRVILVLCCWITLCADPAPEPVVATVRLTSGAEYALTSCAITTSAEGNRFWLTDETGFYRSADFSNVISLFQKDGVWYITELRTGTRRIKEIDNFQFRAETVSGRVMHFYLRQVEWIRFETGKQNKICPLGHVWPNTDFIYCPYDAQMLEPMDAKPVDKLRKKHKPSVDEIRKQNRKLREKK